MTEQKLDDISVQSEANPNCYIFWLHRMGWKKYSSCWYNVAKVMALQNYNPKQQFSLRLQSKNSVL
jgi:hypothetical protein